MGFSAKTGAQRVGQHYLRQKKTPEQGFSEDYFFGSSFLASAFGRQLWRQIFLPSVLGFGSASSFSLLQLLLSSWLSSALPAFAFFLAFGPSAGRRFLASSFFLSSRGLFFLAHRL